MEYKELIFTHIKNVRWKGMKHFKNMLFLSALSMMGGAALATYTLTNTNTKKKADKLLNTAMDEAEESIQKMKKKMK